MSNPRPLPTAFSGLLYDPIVEVNTMNKNLALAAFITAAALLPPASANSLPHPNFSYPTTSSIETDQPVCFMQISDGRTLNLDRLCGRSASRPQVIISRVTQEDNVLVGNVVNQAGKSVHNVQVIYEILNRQSGVRQRSASPTEPSTLGPGQSALFELFGEDGQSLRIVSVKWDE